MRLADGCGNIGGWRLETGNEEIVIDLTLEDFAKEIVFEFHIKGSIGGIPETPKSIVRRSKDLELTSGLFPNGNV